MKNSAWLLAGAMAIIATPAQARDKEWYIGLEGGISLPDTVDIDFEQPNAAGIQADAGVGETNSGIDADVIIGYDFGWFRLETEVGYKQASYDSFAFLSNRINPGAALPLPTTLNNTEDRTSISGMVNGLLEFGKDGGFQVYGGVGAGFANVDLPVEVPGVGVVNSDSQTDLALQLIAGARFPVSDSIDLGIKYRYFGIDEFEYVTATGERVEADYETHSVLASVIYNFGRKSEPAAPPPPPITVAPPPPPPPPPVAIPAPPPPPVPQCNMGPYIVFFDFDDDAITADAQGILNSAINAYGSCGRAEVMLAGHADRSGRVTYNIGLAERRNAAVRQYMTSRGIVGSRIKSKAFGESQPRTPTQDGVREQQNRRVEITYGPASGM